MGGRKMDLNEGRLTKKQEDKFVELMKDDTVLTDMKPCAVCTRETCMWCLRCEKFICEDCSPCCS